METFPVEDLAPTITCLRYYRERILGATPGSDFDDLEERRRIRIQIMAGLGSAVEIDPAEHELLSKVIKMRPGRRYRRSGDVVYVIEDRMVISVFRFALWSPSLDVLVVRPCLANYLEKVLRMDLRRTSLDRRLVARITTMIVADLLQSHEVRTGVQPIVRDGIGQTERRRIQDRIFTIEKLGRLAIVRAISLADRVSDEEVVRDSRRMMERAMRRVA